MIASAVITFSHLTNRDHEFAAADRTQNRLRDDVRGGDGGAASTGWQVANTRAPLILSSLTGHLDEHFSCFMLGSDRMREIDAGTFHSINRFQSKVETKTVD